MSLAFAQRTSDFRLHALHRTIEGQFFFGYQWSETAFRKSPELERTDCDSHQTEHLDVESRQHPADMPVLAFLEHDFKPAAFRPCTQNATLRDAQDLTILCSNPLRHGVNEFLVCHFRDL